MTRKMPQPESLGLEEIAKTAVRSALDPKPMPPGPKLKKQPIRTCVACREESPKRDLVRIVRASDGAVKLDATGRIYGRGAYLHPRMECLRLAVKKRALDRSLGVGVSEEYLSALEAEIAALTT